MSIFLKHCCLRISKHDKVQSGWQNQEHGSFVRHRPVRCALPVEISKYKQSLCSNCLTGKDGWYAKMNRISSTYYNFSRWLDHLGDWTPHSMAKTVKIGQNWLSNDLLRQIFLELWKKNWSDNRNQRIKLQQKKMQGAELWNRKLKRDHPIAYASVCSRF